MTYSYDQGAYGLGRRTGMVDASGSESYSYDMAGRVTQVQKVIGSTSYTTAYQLMVDGQLKQITYPSNRVVAQTHDAVGRLTGVASNGVNYTSGYTYDAEGHTTQFHYANGVTAGFTYSPDRSQLTSLAYTNSSQTLLFLNYGYKNGQANCGTGTTTGNDGLIQCIQDATEAGRSVVYTYDPLARITSAVTTGTSGYPKWGLSWTYDRYGNRLTQNVTAGSAYSNTLVFATLPNGVGAYTNRPDTYSFDAIGNMLYDGFNTLTYDSENRITSCAGGGGSGAYVYDNHGTRVKRCLPNCASPTSSTVYVFSGSTDIAEYDNGAVPASPSREYIYAGGKLVATVTSASTTYHHADHLSVRVNTDASGQKIGEQGHYPYGEQWYAANTTTKFFFTTYQRDSESGLDYAMARYYISRFGRYCSMDPVGGSPGNPQSWNRYAYAGNNPINATDPSGTFWHWLLKAFMTWAFMGSNMALPGGGVPGDFPAPPSATSTEVWSEQLPISTSSQGIPPGGIIDESGGFGQGFMAGSNPPLTDCLRLASIADDIGKRVHSDVEFMDEMARTFTAANDSSIAEMRRTANMAPRNKFGDTGFKQEFRDGSNQVRHFTGGLVAGYRLGEDLGRIVMNYREDPNPNGENDPDIALNAQSTQMGWALKPYPPHTGTAKKPFTYHELGAQIRSRICE